MNWHEWSWMIGAAGVIGVLGFIFWSMMVVAKRDDEDNERGEREMYERDSGNGAVK